MGGEIKHFVFFVPFDLNQQIYPWGPHLVSKALEQNCHGVSARVVDLRDVPYFREAYQYFIDHVPLGQLEWDLRKLADSSWERFAFQKNSLFAGAALYGAGLLPRLRHIVPDVPVQGEHLDQVKSILECGLREQFDSVIKEDPETTWGFSTFDVFVESLLLGRLLKEIYPSTSVLLGGSRIERSAARKVIANRASQVDGVILGPGEKPMVHIARALLNGQRIGEIDHERLMNKRFLANTKYTDDYVRLPPAQVDGKFELDFDAVAWDPVSGIIHILEDVRCRWSECTFCREAEFFQRYHKDFYSPEIEDIARSVASVLKGIAETGTSHEEIRITIDSDDPTMECIERIVRYCVLEMPADLRDALPKIRMWSYCRVRQIAKEGWERMHYLKGAPKFQLDLNIPIETMNPVTLQRMVKGNNVMTNIKALKVAMDCGINHSGCWIFSFYPGEDFQSVKTEMEYWKAIYHLIPPGGTTPMWASEGSPMGQRQERYGIEIQQSDEHPLVKEMLGFGVPWGSYASYRLTDLEPGIKGRLVSEYHRFMEARRICYGKSEYSPGNLIKQAGLWLRFLSWQCLALDFTYLQRVLFYRRWFSPRRRDKSQKDRGSFRLNGNMLVRTIPGRMWGRSKTTRTTVNEVELRLLRFLYHHRKRSELFAHMQGELSKDEVLQLLEKHLRLGSVATYGNTYISVFCDPEHVERLSRTDLDGMMEVTAKPRFPPINTASLPVLGETMTG